MDHLAHEPCLLAGSFQLLRWMQYSYTLMMEQADSRKCHHHAVLIAGFDHLVLHTRNVKIEKNNFEDGDESIARE